MKALRNQTLCGVLMLGLTASLRADEAPRLVGGSLGSTTIGGYVDTSGSFGSPAAVPEPGSLALAAVGAVVLLVAGRRARRRK